MGECSNWLPHSDPCPRQCLRPSGGGETDRARCGRESQLLALHMDRNPGIGATLELLSVGVYVDLDRALKSGKGRLKQTGA